jgi:sugar phosphate permease
MILAPYSALVPDIVTVEQRGTASGWLGGMSIAGYLAAGVLSYKIDDLGILGAYLVMIVVHGFAMVLCSLTCFRSLYHFESFNDGGYDI